MAKKNFVMSDEIEIPDDIKANIQEMGLGGILDDVDLDEIDDLEEEKDEEEDDDLDDEDEEIEDEEDEEEVDDSDDEDDDLDDEADDDDGFDDDDDLDQEQVKNSRGAAAERKKWKKRLTKAEEKHQEELDALNPYKRIVDTLSKVTGKDPDQLEAAIIDNQVKKYVEDGMSEDLAKKYVNDTLSNGSPKKQKTTNTREVRRELEKDVDTLAASNPIYSGIAKHEDEVIDYAIKHDMTAKQAYRALYGDEVDKKMKKATENERRAKNRKRKGAKVSTSKGAGSGSTKRQKSLGLTKDQQESYRQMGVSPAAMSKMKGVGNIDDFRKKFKKK